MAEQGAKPAPVPNDNTGIFTWQNIRKSVAGLVNIGILLIGALTSATGGFKGIPVLLTFLSLLYPLAVPTYVVTALCVISAISGFTVFWGSYQESLTRNLTPYTEKFLDFLKNLITFKWNNTSELTQIEHPLSNKHTTLQGLKGKQESELDQSKNRRFNALKELIGEQERKKELYKHIEALVAILNGTHHHEFREKIALFAPSHDDTLSQFEDADDPHNETPFKLDSVSNIIYYLLQLLVASLSWLFILFGTFVAVGIGILTNQGFFDYAGITLSSFAITFCFIAAVMKQVCQFSFSAEKQRDTIYLSVRWIGIHIDTAEELTIKKNERFSAKYKNESDELREEIKSLEDIHLQLLNILKTNHETQESDIKTPESVIPVNATTQYRSYSTPPSPSTNAPITPITHLRQGRTATLGTDHHRCRAIRPDPRSRTI
jgi:hypothetical protein